MDRTFVLAGAVAGLIAVAFGAFGAHGLRGRLSPEMLAVFETGVRYHMYHALALLLTAALIPRFPGTAMVAAGWLSSPASCCSRAVSIAGGHRRHCPRAITPIGGRRVSSGWASLVVAMFQQACKDGATLSDGRPRRN
jgi:uncharacterized membrane protein YgdD (TMEM256/DUF423 family)